MELWLQVFSALRGDEVLPWEGEMSEDLKGKLGALREPILAMLHRDPTQRVSMKDAYDSIVHMERTT